MDSQTFEFDTRECLIALPFQFIETSRGTILKRGCVEILITGERAVETLETLLPLLKGEGRTPEELSTHFADPDWPTILQLIKQLKARNFIVPAGSSLVPINGETHLDVFYWQFGVSTIEVNKRLNSSRFLIIGVNNISIRLATSLASAGVTNVTVIDHPMLRNCSFFDEFGNLLSSAWTCASQPLSFDDWFTNQAASSFDCLIATSDFGGLKMMRRWNKLCVEQGRHFLPIVLRDMIGYVGPLVIPSETACFQCFLSRLDSNRLAESAESLSEPTGSSGNTSSAFLPSMASVLADLATIEIIKFYSRSIATWKVGSVLEVNLLAGRVQPRRVLRVPRCPVCSSLVRRSSLSVSKGSLIAKLWEK